VPQKWRSDLGCLIEDTPELDWLLLTKRPENYEKLAPWPLDKIPANVWLGVTCEDQQYYERRWGILSRTRIRATAKFVSYEPALGQIDQAAASNGRKRSRPDHLRRRVWQWCTPHEASMGPGVARRMR
jgi:protein gp37